VLRKFAFRLPKPQSSLVLLLPNIPRLFVYTRCIIPGVPELPWRERLASFLRSVIPADPSQLLFLAGIVCLVVSSRLSWLPSEKALAPFHPDSSEYFQMVFDTRIFLIFPSLLSLFSGFAGYFVCFWPGARPIRRTIFLVLIPALAGIGLDLGRLLYVDSLFTSVLNHNIVGNLPTWPQLLLWTSAPGFHFGIAGIILVGVFVARMLFGLARLPLSLNGTTANNSLDGEFWYRAQLIIWVLLGPLLFAVTIPTVTIFMFPIVASRISIITENAWFPRISSFIESLMYLGMICWVGGRSFRETVRASVRLFQPLYLVISAAVPFGIALIISTGNYLFDRSIWAEHEFGYQAAPLFGGYFTFPNPWLLLMFFAALYEEIVFRGFLLKILDLRYGLYRGMFLTGIIWAAFHFHSDATFNRTEQSMLWQLLLRICICLGLNSVFCWLTLKSGSVIPAAIAHTLYNVIVLGGFGPNFPNKIWIQAFLWGALALLLFIYSPIPMRVPENQTAMGQTPEPAV
jgi:membrane protease YdiL (CAAX protease family)